MGLKLRIFVFVAVILLLFILSNFLFSKPLILTSEDKAYLRNIYTEKQINSANYYIGGPLAFVSSTSICGTIHLNKDNIQNSTDYLYILTHEIFHTVQDEKKGKIKCYLTLFFSGSFVAQLKAQIKYADRRAAYFYPLDKEQDYFKNLVGGQYNVEQEAALVADYSYLSYLGGNLNYPYLLCYDYRFLETQNDKGYQVIYCGRNDDLMTQSDVLSKLGPSFEQIIKKY